MNLVVNGKEADVKDNLTIPELLVCQQVKMPEMVSIELNGNILKRDDFDQTVLKEGDKVEFLYFMGGGNAIK